MIAARRAIAAEDVACHYDELDRLYRAIWGEHLHHGVWRSGTRSKDEAVKNLCIEVARSLALKPGDSVCDIGCGYGGTARHLADVWAARVTGITLSENQLRIALAKSAGSERQSFVLGDWLRNEFADGEFDHAIAIESTEHMADKKAFFREAWRVLKPGGRLVVCAWLPVESPSAWQKRFLLEPICAEGRMPSMLSATEHVAHYLRAGFEGLSWRDLSHAVKKTWSLSILGLARHLWKDPVDRGLVLKRRLVNADFLKSLFRIRAAFETGAMGYGLFVGRKPLP